MPIINIEDIETYLDSTIDDGDPSVTGLEGKWQFIIDAVNTKIETICNRKFDDTAYTEKVDGTGQKEILLKQYPIISLTSINYVNPLDDVTTELDIDDVEINYDTGEIYYYAGFLKGRYNISVVYSAGYTSIPDDLKLVACITSNDNFKNVNKLSGIKKEKTGKYEYEVFGGNIDISDANMRIISNYVRYD